MEICVLVKNEIVHRSINNTTVFNQSNLPFYGYLVCIHIMGGGDNVHDYSTLVVVSFGQVTCIPFMMSGR